MSATLESLTKRTRTVLKLAQEEAVALNHNYIGTEHLLLALVSEQKCLAAEVLASLGVSEQMIRDAALDRVGKGERKPFGKPALDPRTEKVIELAVDIRNRMGHKYIGTEHLLMGIVVEGEGMAAQLLAQFVSLSSIEPQITTTILGSDPAALKTLPEAISSGLLQSPSLQSRQSSLDQPNIFGKHGLLYQEILANQQKAISANAAQEERNRIARDLHDSIKQQLFNIAVSAAAVRKRWQSDPDGAVAALDDVQESARAAMVEMNAMLMQLSPAPLEKTGLVEALREQCQALAYRTGAQVNTAFGNLPPEEELPLGTQMTLFRIAQEALTNVSRHARAKQVRLRLNAYPGEKVLVLEVSDDGQGYDPAKTPAGMGVVNMRERADHLCGTVEIGSVPGQGTTVRVEIPFLGTVPCD